MAIRLTIECGHTSELRAQRTPEGYTHDWQVFVRGVDNAEIHHYIEKVVFHLHETFPKPKRVLKEPPYVVKESGYAGFEIPIYVYLKNKDEPKRFHFSYDLQLQPSGPAINKVDTHTEVFYNPNEDFRKKLLKGGAIVVSNIEGAPEKSKAPAPMVGKPKLSGTEGKKHRMSEPKASNAFADLFGPPIKTAGTKVSPETKKPSTSSSLSEKTNSTKPSSSEKVEKTEKSTKVKHSPHKDGKKEKSAEDRKDKKDRESSKDKDRSKDKSKRSQSPMNKNNHASPGTKRPSSPPPIKKPQTPPPQPPKRAPSPKSKEKEPKKVTQEKEKEKEKDKVKDSSKSTSDESRSEKKKDKKKHKEDKEKEKKDKHKDKERDKSKESKESKSVEKKVEKVEKPEKVEKEKTQEFKPPKEGRKSPKAIKEADKVKDEKPPKLDKIEKNEKIEKTKESKDKEKQKHKHKKRDKKEKRDGSKEREKKEKREKNKSSNEKQNSNVPPPVATNPLSTLLAEMPDRDSSDSAPSLDDETFVEPKPVPVVKKESASVLAPTISNESKPNMSPPPPSDKKSRSDRSKREKSKGSREDKETKKRKRRSESKGDEERSIKKERDQSSSPLDEPVSSSQSPIAVDMESAQLVKIKDDGASNKQSTGKSSEGDGEQVAPDSTNGSLAEPEAGDIPSFSEEYVSQLKDLQHKIMTLQDNQELQRVVQVIAETGQYEITKKTFDFDLCTLDRRTVQRLQQFFAS